jgi:hypothetical protein
MTCTAWKERFNVQYTYCGCPLPGDTIGKRLSRVVGIYAPPPPASHLMPFDSPDLLSATHPSDHNAVRFQSANNRAHARATKRYEQLARTKERERHKAAEKARKKAAKAGAAGTAAHEHGERRRVDSRDVYNHQSAFLTPIPLYYGPSYDRYGGCVGGGTMVSYRGGCSSVRSPFFRVSPIGFDIIIVWDWCLWCRRMYWWDWGSVFWRCAILIFLVLICVLTERDM